MLPFQPAGEQPLLQINNLRRAPIINTDDDAVFESETPIMARRGTPRMSSDLPDSVYSVRTNPFHGNVAPKNAPVWMTTLPFLYYPANNASASGNDRKTLDEASVSTLAKSSVPLRLEVKTNPAVEAEVRLPFNWAFVKYWLTKPNTSLFLFREEDFIRTVAFKIVNWRVFEYLILAAIIANVVVMMLQQSLPENDRAPITDVLDRTELPFVIFFTVEAVLKIIAIGFVLNKESYLRSFWNVLDFIVVVTGLMTVLFTAIDLSILRTLRILRPLKLLTRIRALRVILQAIITAMVPLSQIAAILLFIVAIFAVIGMQFYNGIFHWTCFDRMTGQMLPDPKPCAADGMVSRGINACPPRATCRRFWPGPNEGITNFDNIGFAMLTVFQCVTTEGWTDMMYTCDGVYGRTFNWVYFSLLIVVGTFFMLNLVLGVLSAEFAKERGRVEKRRQYLRKHRKELFNREVNSYLEWITVAENSLLNDPAISTEVKLRVIEVRRENEARRDRKKHGGLDKFRSIVTLSTTTMTSAPSSPGADSSNINNDDVFAQQVAQDEAREDAADLAAEKKLKTMTPLARLRRKTQIFIRSQFFFWIVIIFVILNAISLGLEFYNQPTWLDQTLRIFAIIFAVVFCLEIAIKMFALGVVTYFESKQNIFETIVIVGSVLELILQTFNSKWSVGISVLRCFRILRIFKLTRYWPLLKSFVISVIGSLTSIASLLIFLMLFLIIFALLGMELFGGDYNFDEGRPPFHFDNFPTAIITVFQLTTAKDWPLRMFDGVKSKGGVFNNGMAYAPYFIVVVVFGTYTLLNLFLAIAVDSIASGSEVEITEQGTLKRRSTADESDDLASINSMESKESDEEEKTETTEQQESNNNSEDVKPDPSTHRQKHSMSTAERHKFQSELITMPSYSSFYIFKQTNFFRRICFEIASDPLFDYFVLAAICASTVALAAEDPVDGKAYSTIGLSFLDYGFTAIFTLEMLLKLIVLGFVAHPGSYLRDPWNIIDAVVVLSAYVGFILEGSHLGGSYATAVKSLRIIRVLRPLKTVRRIPKLQAVLTCIIASLGKVVNVLIMFAMFDYIFSCLAIQLFAGKFFYCTDRTKLTENECQGQFFLYDGEGQIIGVDDRKWLKYDLNFDNLVMAMFTLFTVTTGDGWPTVMIHSIEATEINRGPLPAYNQGVAVFYMVFLIICPFFLVNVFVAVMVVTFQDQGEDKEIDKNEKRCIDYVINAKPINTRLPPPELRFRRQMWYFVESTPFEAFIIAFVFLTCIVMMLKHDDQKVGYDEFENVVNFAGAIIFSVEAGLRIYAYGVSGYFKDIWNVFDFFTVTVSVADVLLSEIDPNLIDIGFLRLFRTVRLIKVMRRVRSIRIILWTFVQSFKALPYVCLLMGMAYFAYAVIGMQLFGTIKPTPNSSINDNASFQTFFDALLLLFRITTGEGWPDVLQSCTSGRPCTPFATADSCGTDIGAYIYFISFILLATFLLLNLFVAVILDNFEFLTRDSSILGPHHLDEFVRHWAEFDPNGTGKIAFMDMYHLVRALEPPLGFGINCPTKTAYRKLIRMNIPIEGKMVQFTTTLFALVRESLKIRVGDSKQMDALDKELRQVIVKFWPKFSKHKLHLLMPPEEATGFQQLTTGKIYAGLLLLDLWKNGLENEAGKRINRSSAGSDNKETMQNLVAIASQAALAPILRRSDVSRAPANNKKPVDVSSGPKEPKREIRFSGVDSTNSQRFAAASRAIHVQPAPVVRVHHQLPVINAQQQAENGQQIQRTVHTQLRRDHIEEDVTNNITTTANIISEIPSSSSSGVSSQIISTPGEHRQLPQLPVRLAGGAKINAISNNQHQQPGRRFFGKPLDLRVKPIDNDNNNNNDLKNNNSATLTNFNGPHQLPYV